MWWLKKRWRVRFNNPFHSINLLDDNPPPTHPFVFVFDIFCFYIVILQLGSRLKLRISMQEMLLTWNKGSNDGVCGTGNYRDTGMCSLRTFLVCVIPMVLVLKISCVLIWVILVNTEFCFVKEQWVLVWALCSPFGYWWLRLVSRSSFKLDKKRFMFVKSSDGSDHFFLE